MLASDSFDFSPFFFIQAFGWAKCKKEGYIEIYFIATFWECPYSDLSRDPSDFLLRYKQHYRAAAHFIL